MDRRNPECHPIFTLEDVLAWTPGHDDLCVATVPKRPRKQRDVPKLLVCHDMKGGYLEDRFVQGCAQFDAYRFYNWQYVDTYVYFSHYFVTIPPTGWINAAHRHGTTILGTLITEWNDGKARCEAFLKSEDSYKNFADKLVEIAKYYGFDGWLVNIENVIETEEMVTALRDFVKYLTEEHHRHIPGSQVIWYDSVINTGKLDWQNALNEKNSMFFDVSDGIFLNYCWKDEHLSVSQTEAVKAGRPYDVYVGIDVFGRGCLGDGGYNTCEAMAAVRKHNMSAALFANGWVFETHGAQGFTQNENKFWRLIHQYCYPCVYTSLPLNTSFCQGFGDRFFDNGVPVGNPWWNISIQQLQPTYNNCQFACSLNSGNTAFPISDMNQPHGSTIANYSEGGQSINTVSNQSVTEGQPISIIGNQSATGNQPINIFGKQSALFAGSQSLTGFNESMELCTSDAWMGGSCLKLEADVANYRFAKFNLFSTDIELKQYSAVYVSCTYKIVQDPDCDIFLELHLQHDDQSIVLVLLPFPAGDKPVPEYGKDVACMHVNAMKDTDFAQIPKLLDPALVQPSNTRWKTRCFPIHHLYLTFCKLKLVTVGITTTDPQPKQSIVYLGDLKITPVEAVPETFPVAEMVSIEADTSTSYPLMNVNKNDFDRKPGKTGDLVEWGADSAGNPVLVPYQTLDKMRVSSHTLKEVLPGLGGGNSCEVLYRLITSLDCFTLHWQADNSNLIDHYRVYQIKIDSGVAKLLGHVTQPYYKVTWFEIPDYEKDENVHHFQFVVRPVLRNGIAVPLDYNYCKLFRVASSKSSVRLVKDVSTSASDESGNVAQDTSNPQDPLCGELKAKPEQSNDKKLEDVEENADSTKCDGQSQEKGDREKSRCKDKPGGQALCDDTKGGEADCKGKDEGDAKNDNNLEELTEKLHISNNS